MERPTEIVWVIATDTLSSSNPAVLHAYNGKQCWHGTLQQQSGRYARPARIGSEVHLANGCEWKGVRVHEEQAGCVWVVFREQLAFST